MEVTLDGGHHSSNPSSADFDSALGGATGSSLSQVRFDGAGGKNTLLVAAQRLAHGLAVTAAGAEVVTQDVTVAGRLAIQAQDLTVRGALRSQGIAVTASGWVNIDQAGRIEAGQADAGGRIDLAADVFVNAGQLHADGRSGGQIVVQARNVLNAGPITAKGTSAGGNGGQVDIAFTESYVATTAAVMSASSVAGPGGHLTIDGGNTGHLFTSGCHLVTGSVGGMVDLFGRDIVLSGATVDGSGLAGGGSLRIGGHIQGRNSAVIDADTVTVTPASTIRADAQQSGSGGQVFVWSNQTTAFDGTVSARGGPSGGSGGFIELSGQGALNYAGSADAGAPLGRSGTLLFDPKNIIISDAPAGIFPQFDLIDPHPAAGDGLFRFGAYVTVLNNGNVVVTNSLDDFGGMEAGAIYLFDGLTGALISSLVGSNPHDFVGGAGVTVLSNGNYVVKSLDWNGFRGAANWGNGSMGVSGTVSAANSLVGSNPGDGVGRDIIPLSNGNYVVASSHWNDKRGAATWGDGRTGISGTVSADNSLVGSVPGDMVSSYGVSLLTNGNYVVQSSLWHGNRGAATWGDGRTGISGTVSADNSLVGSGPGDYVGNNPVIPLSNGNYVVASSYWDGQRGAATWGAGSTGVSGTVSADNSLVGSFLGDAVGYYGVTSLRNGNYVVLSPFWNDQRGAATWGDGRTGISGSVSDANSLIGSNPKDYVGRYVTPLRNGNYVVNSPYWNGQRGAVTWSDANTGISGTVSEANSLIGSNPGDLVGYYGGVTPLSNGNYVINSPYWNGRRGAATWGNDSTGISGTVSADNSLVGSNHGDYVGNNPVIPLSNGNYVVSSSYWNDGRGAATWGNGGTGISGTVSEANSLVGNGPRDWVGNLGATALSNGNYVVLSPSWNGNRGAATWGNGTAGASGTISEANSLTGSDPGDVVGIYVAPLSNGNYVVGSPYWNGNRGAVTWGNGSTGISGTVSADNSLVGSYPGDRLGDYYSGSSGLYFPGFLLLGKGNYVVRSPYWNGQRGAATWVNGTSGQTLDGLNTITPQNSLVGNVVNAGLGKLIENPVDQRFLAPFVMEGGGRITAGLADPSQFTYASGQAQTVTLTPDFLTRTLNTGTAVVLEASNDITVNSPIAVSAGGHGGALTLQAGRSILLNASITTDNGALTLIANDQLANGVVVSQRDPGTAVISMARGTVLNTGSGTLTVELRDGAGLTNRDSGAITLQSLTGGSVSVVNNGPSAGSDLNLGPVTSSGPQSYTNSNGTTLVTGNLAATDNPITFNQSVVLNAGLTLSAGSSTVNFAAGTVSPSPGGVTIAGGVVLTGSTTFSATLNGTNPGSYSQLAAGGPINLGGSTLSLVLGFEPPVGSIFEIITNTGTGTITGTFNGLDEGAAFSHGGFVFQITYQGGTGRNSVVLARLQ